MRIAILYESEVARRNLEKMLSRDPDCGLQWCVKLPSQVAEGQRVTSADVLLVEASHAARKLRQLEMKNTPPCVLVSDQTQGNSQDLFEALGMGAVDVIRLEGLYQDDGQALDPTGVLGSKLNTISGLLGLKARKRAVSEPVEPGRVVPRQRKDAILVLVGCSTGGPAALETLLSGLKPDCGLAVVVAQHLDAVFVEDFIKWLGSKLSMPVHAAEAGARPSPGEVHIAHTEQHLMLDSKGCYQYTEEPRDYSYRPSVNLLFSSALKAPFLCREAILLTGMGRDGAEGMLALREAGVHTIAQHRDSCIVYGMPGTAVAMNAASQVLSLEEIADHLGNLALAAADSEGLVIR